MYSLCFERSPPSTSVLSSVLGQLLNDVHLDVLKASQHLINVHNVWIGVCENIPFNLLPPYPGLMPLVWDRFQVPHDPVQDKQLN